MLQYESRIHVFKTQLVNRGRSGVVRMLLRGAPRSDLKSVSGGEVVGVAGWCVVSIDQDWLWFQSHSTNNFPMPSAGTVAGGPTRLCFFLCCIQLTIEKLKTVRLHLF